MMSEKMIVLNESELAALSTVDSLDRYITELKNEGAALLAAGETDQAKLETLDSALTAAEAQLASVKRAEEIKARFSAPVVEAAVEVAEAVTETVEEVASETTFSAPAPADTPTITAPLFRVLVGNKAAAAKYGRTLTSATQFGEALLEAHRNASGPVQGRDETTHKAAFSVETQFGLGVTWGQDAEENMKSWESIVRPSAVAAMDPDMEESLVASGGYCKPLNTNYDIPFYAEECPTFDQFLPNVQTNDGGVKFMRPPAIDSVLEDAALGVAIITCAEDKAGYTTETPAGPTPAKPCTKIECPTVDECCVDMITSCIVFGNLNYRTFPQYVQYALKAMAVAWNRKLNQYFLDKIDDPANSMPVEGGAATYTTEADLLRDLLTLKARWNAQYGRCHGSSMLKVALPSWVKDALTINAANRGVSGGVGSLTSLLRSEGLDVFWFEGQATGVAALAPQVAGPIVALPTKAVGYVFAADTFTVLAGGELNFGLVRDSALNHVNNLEIMIEKFIGLCKTGSQQAYRIEFNVCPNGTTLGDRPGPDAPAC
jgi:hypothetical protein